MRYDVAVIGLGGMGSALAANCARRGASVIGLEQFGPAHELGSSNGRTRMIRQAYFEDPAYVPLLLRAYDLWRELEENSGTTLLQITGLLMVGPAEAPVIAGAQRSAAQYGLPLEVWEAAETRQRYPELRILPNEIAVFENNGGVLAPQRAVEAHLRVAAQAGAVLRFGTTVERWDDNGDGFDLSLGDGSRFSARRLILALGSWFADSLGALGVELRVQRNVQAWFTPASDAYRAGKFPPFLLDRAGLPAPLYGFPDFGDGVKAAFHAHGRLTTAAALEREIDPMADIAPIVSALEEWMPGAGATFREAKVCPYSLTPDEHFLIDRHPQHPGLILCGGFSGHGFKFAPVVGEIAADLALEGATRHPIDFLSLRRFAGKEKPR